MKFQFATGGREKYFKVNIHTVRDCVVRAICNATGKDYKEVYDAINVLSKGERTGKRKEVPAVHVMVCTRVQSKNILKVNLVGSGFLA